ncbi:uncharacterized protein EV422DRAFT_82015 [Fimicolochytrium jonesii]|uniref:uncharacterized protein n=1 Tax=Fimicolochytrium jonesii TaxID=1396493 RepID=UPI0022FDBB39|nr:uncharacterized protein EV422DRAFT_82015 [Fimicolochytrium jonesii]KAI8820188.1 hypothetical protein EV422DRAFT_82015 [Fimicolochytrium jonesii]
MLLAQQEKSDHWTMQSMLGGGPGSWGSGSLGEVCCCGRGRGAGEAELGLSSVRRRARRRRRTVGDGGMSVTGWRILTVVSVMCIDSFRRMSECDIGGSAWSCSFGQLCSQCCRYARFDEVFSLLCARSRTLPMPILAEMGERRRCRFTFLYPPKNTFGCQFHLLARASESLRSALCAHWPFCSAKRAGRGQASTKGHIDISWILRMGHADEACPLAHAQITSYTASAQPTLFFLTVTAVTPLCENQPQKGSPTLPARGLVPPFSPCPSLQTNDGRRTT